MINEDITRLIRINQIIKGTIITIVGYLYYTSVIKHIKNIKLKKILRKH
jgi:hypothetical protein